MTIPNELLMSQSAEAAVCGSMVIDPKIIPTVLEWVTPESFALQENRMIFEAIMKVWRHNPGGQLDGVLLRNELETSGALKDVGGLDYLRKVVESVPTSANGVYYARQVAERQRYRAAVDAVERMRIALAEGGAADEVIQGIQGLAMGLECGARTQNIFRVADHATTVALQTQDTPCVIRSGFRDVDAKIGGVNPGDIAYIAGRPGSGKTSFACGWALNAAGTGKHVVFFTLEMMARVLMERLSATLGTTSMVTASLARIKQPNPPKEMLDAFYQGSLMLEKLPITIVENAAAVEQMTATMRQLKQVGPVDLVMIDYVGLMSASESRNRNRNEQVSEISRSLKRMAQIEHVPVVVAAQLNRECEARENHRPRMSDLRDSGSQEQDGDLILLLHREDYYRKMANPETTEIDGLAEVIVAKARNGPTGMAQLVFVEEAMKFVNMARIDDTEEAGYV